MEAGRSPATRILIMLAQRVGAALGLGLSIAFARGFWDTAIESFAEGILEGLVGALIAIVITGLSLALVYATLGTQVDQLTVRIISLVAGTKEKTVSLRSEVMTGAAADLLAVPIYLVIAAFLVIAGVREAHATWTMLGFAAMALAALSFVSMLVEVGLILRLRGPKQRIEKGPVIDAERIDKGGEIAGVFASLAVLSLTVSASVFASMPTYRYPESAWPLSFGDWARLCIGQAAGCKTQQVLTFEPEKGRKTRVEVASSQASTLRSKGRTVALDASGQPVRLMRSKDSGYGWEATFLPAPDTTYEVVLETPGHYSVRYRNAP